MPIAARIQDFMTWWAGELLSFLPARDDRDIFGRAKGVEVKVKRDSVSVYRKVRMGQPLAQAELSADGVPLQACLSGLGRIRKVRLTFDKSICFYRQSRLPAAAHHRAGKMLGLELQQVLPFNLSEIAAGWFRTGTAGHGFADYVQVAIKREDIATAITALRAQGARVEAVGIRDGSSAALPVMFDVEGVQLGARLAARWRRYFIISFAFCGLAALGAAAALSWKSSANAARIAEATDEVAGKVKAVRSSLESLRSANSQLQTLLTVREDRLRVPLYWTEVAEVLPDTAWVQSMTLKTSAITLEGDAKNAEDLIGILEKSELFSNVRFAAPVFLDPASQQLHFSITMERQAKAK